MYCVHDATDNSPQGQIQLLKIPQNTYRGLSAGLQYPQCVSIGDTAVLH